MDLSVDPRRPFRLDLVGVRVLQVTELEIVVELGNLQNLVFQKVFLVSDIYKVEQQNVSEIAAKIICFA